MEIYSHSGILFSHEKEWSSDTPYNVGEPQMHYVEWKKPDTTGLLLYDPIYMKWPVEILQHLFWAWYSGSGPYIHSLLLELFQVREKALSAMVRMGVDPSSKGKGLRLRWLKKRNRKVNTSSSNFNKNNNISIDCTVTMRWTPSYAFLSLLSFLIITGTRVNNNRTHYMLSPVLSVLCLPTHSILIQPCDVKCYVPHFVEEETEAQRRNIFCSRSKPFLTLKPFQLLCCVISHADISSFLSRSMV